MKKSLYLSLVFCMMVSLTIQGQQNRRSNEKIRSLKIAYITQELDLSAKEAQEFWPVYNEFDKKVRNLERNERSKIRMIIKESNGYKNLSEEKAAEILSRIHDIENQIVKTKFEMDKQLGKIISKKKILRLRHIEREFVRNLMNKLRNRKRKGMERN